MPEGRPFFSVRRGLSYTPVARDVIDAAAISVGPCSGLASQSAWTIILSLSSDVRTIAKFASPHRPAP